MTNSTTALTNILTVGILGIVAISLLRGLSEGIQPPKSKESKMEAMKEEGLVKKVKGKWKLTAKGKRALEEHEDEE